MSGFNKVYSFLITACMAVVITVYIIYITSHKISNDTVSKCVTVTSVLLKIKIWHGIK